MSAHTRGWESGKRYSYRLKLVTTVAFQDAKTFDFDLTGTVELTPVAVTPEVATLYASVADAKIVSRIAGSQPSLDKVAQDIRTSGAFISLNGGRSSELRVSPDVSAMAKATFRQLAAALQFVESREPATRYTAEEYDTTGRYLVEYERQGDARLWHKRKLHYLSLLGDGAAKAQPTLAVLPKVTASSGEIRLLEGGRPEAIELRDGALVEGAQVPIHSTVRVSLLADRELPALGQRNLSERFASQQPMAASEPIGADVPVSALDDARIGDLDFDTIVRRLEERANNRPTDGAAPSGDGAIAASNPVREQEDSRLFLALSAMFRRHPATVDQALARIRAKSSAADALLDALGAAASPDAQGVLVRLVVSKATEPSLRERALATLVRTRKPTAQAIDALKSVVREAPHDRAALYGLGTYSRRLRDEGRAAAAGELGEFLSVRLSSAKSVPARVTLLRAIANSGYVGALPRVRDHLHDEREEVRVAAVRALQSMRDSRVDGIIAEQLRSDPASGVRLSAIEAAVVRDPTPTLSQAISDAGTEAPDPKVRYRAVELMVRWLPSRPEFRSVLEGVARKDEVERVRQAAKAAL